MSLVTRLRYVVRTAGDGIFALFGAPVAHEDHPQRALYAALRLQEELKTELAETDFREAIALAQKMQAKAWELRATTSLARLLAKQGRRDEARTMLATIYGWFTEGFDTADLIDAKALLDELSA
jgi:predicted ATPase